MTEDKIQIEAAIKEQLEYIAAQKNLNKAIPKRKKPTFPKAKQEVPNNILEVDSKGFILNAQRYNKLKNRNVFDFILPETRHIIVKQIKALPTLTPTEIRCMCYSMNFLYSTKVEVTKVRNNLYLVKVVYGRKKSFEYRFCDNW
ncbi:MAG: hypothetical protein GY710_26225 [Desulfobacteraceae bacterium]|nr:hypothetical protein [Desulfobacteraceae bacterium]